MPPPPAEGGPPEVPLERHEGGVSERATVAHVAEWKPYNLCDMQVDIFSGLGVYLFRQTLHSMS